MKSFFLISVHSISNLLALISIWLAAAFGKPTITKNIGMLHLFEEASTFEYNINLNEYYNNAVALEIMTDRLSNFCTKLTDRTQCEFFLYNNKKNINNMKTDIEYVKTYKVSRRKKRWLALLASFVIQITVSAVTSAVVTYIIEKNNKPNNGTDLITNLVRFLHNEEEDREMRDKEEKIKKEYTALLDAIMMLGKEHDRLTRMFYNIYTNGVKSTFFTIVNPRNFSETLNNTKLAPYLIYPSHDVHELLDMSETWFRHNETHLTFYVHVPLIYEIGAPVHELIPIPFAKNNSIRMLNMNSIVYLNISNAIRIVPSSDFDLCLQTDNRIICNSMITERYTRPSECIHMLITRNNHGSCETKTLEPKNYIMQTSPTSLYCYIINPITLKISCEDQDEIYKLGNPTEISYRMNCNFYKLKNSEGNNTLINYRVIDLSSPKLGPEFAYYDLNLNDWNENITEINRKELREIRVDFAKIANERKFLWQDFRDYVGGKWDEFISLFDGWMMKTVAFVSLISLAFIIATSTCNAFCRGLIRN